MAQHSFWNFICCQPEDDEPHIQTRRQYRHTQTQSQQLQIMGNTVDGNYMIVRLTQKNFFVDVMQRKCKQPTDPQTINFSLFEKGIKYEPAEEIYLLPEKVLTYIAKRVHDIQPTIIIDGLCRSGSALIQLAQEGFVLGLNPTAGSLRNTVTNCGIYQVVSGYGLIQAHVTQLPIMQHDLLYIQPEYDRPSEALFSLQSNLRPNIGEILKLKSKNIIIVLPKFISVHELSSMISFYVKKYGHDYFKIEIQQIQVDGYLVNYIVYLGSVGAVSQQDEIKFMAELCIEDSNNQNFFGPTYDLLTDLSDHNTPRQIMDLILYSKQLAEIQSETTLQQFIQQILIRGPITESQLNRMFGHYWESMLQVAGTPCIANEQLQQTQTFGGRQELPDFGIKQRKTGYISFKCGYSINDNNDNDALMDLLDK